MPQGVPGSEQADIATVARYQKALDALCTSAEVDGVVLTIDLTPRQPLAQGNYHMHPLVRPVWWNSDHQGQPPAK